MHPEPTAPPRRLDRTLTPLTYEEAETQSRMAQDAMRHMRQRAAMHEDEGGLVQLMGLAATLDARGREQRIFQLAHRMGWEAAQTHFLSMYERYGHI